MTILKIATVVAFTAFMAAAWAPAEAKIDCRDGYQRVAGAWLSTPYCRDLQVAEVAREYGMKASAVEIRNNPHYKRDVCRIVGQDIRVKQACEEVLPDDSGGF